MRELRRKCALMVLLVVVREPPVGERKGILSVEPDGLIVVGHGPWEIALGTVHVAAVVKGGGIIRV